MINISQLGVTIDGDAALEADCEIVPGNPAVPARQDRAGIRATGPVATDRDVVALVGAVLGQPADRIDVAALPGATHEIFLACRALT